MSNCAKCDAPEEVESKSFVGPVTTGGCNGCGTGGNVSPWPPLPINPDPLLPGCTPEWDNPSFNASGTPGGIRLSWNLPLVRPECVAHTKIFRSVTDQYSDSELLTTSGGSFFWNTENIVEDTTYYYWIQLKATSAAGISPVYGPMAATMWPTIDEIIDQMKDRISESELNQWLNSQINLIPVIEFDLDIEKVERVDADNALDEMFAGLAATQGVIDASIASLTTKVIDDEKAYIDQIDLIITQFNQSLAAFQTQLVVLADADSALLTYVESFKVQFEDSNAGYEESLRLLAEADTALGVRIDTLTAEVGEGDAANAAAIVAESVVRADADSAMAADIKTLQASQGGDDGDLALIQQELLVQADADAALAASISTLQGEFDDNTAQVRDELTALVTEDEAQASQILQLQADFGDVSSADYQSQIDAIADAEAATASEVTTLQARVTTGEAGQDALEQGQGALEDGQSNLEEGQSALEDGQNALEEGQSALVESTALIQAELIVQSTVDGVLASDISNLQTSTGDNSLLIQSETTARIEGDTALGVRIDTIQLEVDTGDGGVLSASVQELLSVVGINADGSDDGEIDTLTAQYSVKTSVDGYVSGFGLYNDGASSEFGIHADTFYIASPMAAQGDVPTQGNAEQVFPFIIAPWTPPPVGGVEQTPIDIIALNAKTLIPDAHIGTATIQEAAIKEAQIDDAAVTNLKIGNFIASDDFNPYVPLDDRTGWFISKSINGGPAYAEFHDVVIRGNLSANSIQADSFRIVDTKDLAFNSTQDIDEEQNGPDWDCNYMNYYMRNLTYNTELDFRIECEVPELNRNGYPYFKATNIYPFGQFPWVFADVRMYIRAAYQPDINIGQTRPGPWYSQGYKERIFASGTTATINCNFDSPGPGPSEMNMTALFDAHVRVRLGIIAESENNSAANYPMYVEDAIWWNGSQANLDLYYEQPTIACRLPYPHGGIHLTCAHLKR